MLPRRERNQGRAHRHEKAILAAVGNGRFRWAARHVFRHRHRRPIDHRLIGRDTRVHGGGHGHDWPCNRAKNKPDDCHDGQQTAYGGQGLHSPNIAQRATWEMAELGNAGSAQSTDIQCRRVMAVDLVTGPDRMIGCSRELSVETKSRAGDLRHAPGVGRLVDREKL